VIRQRVFSAALIVVLLVAGVLWLPAAGSVAVLSVVLLAAAWEWAGFLTPRRVGPRLLFVVAGMLLCALWWKISGGARGLRALLWVAGAMWSVALAWVFVRPERVGPALVAASGLLAISFAWLALARMRIDWVHGGDAVMYALLIVWLADSGAYFAGRTFGQRKLAPSVSPGKTWAGLFGGIFVCALLAVVTAQVRQLPMLPLLAVTVVAGLFSVVGDLTESLCKRFAGVKDSGTLIPGHGGVLDRFDSLLAAAPLLMLGVELLPGLRG
jgi:phosphatidate cytidylyltransferase